MKNKLLIFLVLGIFSTFTGKAKSEEICNYSNEKDYKICKRNNSSIINPSYPFDLKGGGEMRKYMIYLWGKDYDFCDDLVKKGLGFNRINIGSKKGKELIVSKGTFKNLSADINVNQKENIPYEHIIKWTKKDFSCWQWPHVKYSISYLDENYKIRDLFFSTGPRTEKDFMISGLLENISKLKNNESRTVTRAMNLKLNNKEKELEIIKTIIKASDEKKNCLLVENLKYPLLVSRYKELSLNINPLRAKLDLPPSTELKPICNL